MIKNLLKRGAVLVLAAMVVYFGFSLSASAESYTVKMGADNGALVFEPSTLTIHEGDTVKWVNNKAYPHNIVFGSADADFNNKYSYKKLLAAPGQAFEKTFEAAAAGEYSYFCTPHRGAGMVGKIVVE